MAAIKIECPKCQWQPKPNSKWGCSCGTLWNTFDTGGRCPTCGRMWRLTQCQSSWEGGCQQWSPHLDWYNGLDPAIEEELKEVNIVIEKEEKVLAKHLTMDK